MKKKYIFAALVSAMGLFSCSDSETFLESGVQENIVAPISGLADEAVEGELLIKFKPEVEEVLEKAQMLSRSGVQTRSSIPSVDEILDIAGAYTFERVFPVDKRHEERTRKNGLHLWYVVKFDKDMDLNKVALDMSKLSEVATVEYNQVIKRGYDTTKKAKGLNSATREAIQTLGSQTQTENMKLQWGIGNDGTVVAGAVTGYDVNCVPAWEKCQGDPSIIVAVVDEGVMYNHEDLVNNMWKNQAETFGSDEDADGNGYAGDKYGYNFVAGNGHISYTQTGDTGHASHVAGVIAAENNTIGIRGIAGGDGTPGTGVKIMSCQIFSGEGASSVLNQAKAIKYAADNGAVILQCSWSAASGRINPLMGTPGFTSDEEWSNSVVLQKEALEYFIHNAGDPNGVIDGGIAVFAAGNEYAPMVSYPGAYGDFICVTALDPAGKPSCYTNYVSPSGSKNLIAAPGGDANAFKDEKASILSTMPNSAIEGSDLTASQSGYGYMDGTSMACPHVSGVAALGLSYAAKLRKHYRASDFKDLLLASVRDLSGNLSDEKSYWENWGSVGEAAPHLRMNLPAYRGNIGGLIDAQAVLANIDGSNFGAQPMRVPNVYVALDATETVNLNRIYADNVTATEFNVVDSSIAAVSLDNNQLKVKGTKVGTTKASVTNSDGKTQEFVITVRKATGNGWM